MTAVGREHQRPLVDDWRARAACRGMADVFFPPGATAGSAARDVCQGCEVKVECREWAILTVTADEVEAGTVFAGVSARTIKRWRAQRFGTQVRPIDHGSYAGYEAHRRRGEAPCGECREAYNAYNRAANARRRMAS